MSSATFVVFVVSFFLCRDITLRYVTFNYVCCCISSSLRCRCQNLYLLSAVNTLIPKSPSNASADSPFSTRSILIASSHGTPNELSICRLFGLLSKLTEKIFTLCQSRRFRHKSRFIYELESFQLASF